MSLPGEHQSPHRWSFPPREIQLLVQAAACIENNDEDACKSTSAGTKTKPEWPLV